MSGRMLRPEARPLDLKDLSLSQLETLDRVVSSMKEARDQLPSSERQECAPKLDPKRSSRLYFVSGEPGIGKTTIYTTLRKLLSEESGAQSQGEGEPDAFRHATDKRNTLKKRIRDNLPSLERGVRWLEPLDLEPLPGSTNLLAAVLVRIERALEPNRAPKNRASAGGLLDRSPETRDAMAELNSFQNDLAMSWEGNLQARAAHVEPDTYAAEVLRAERARLSVNQRLQEILSKLVSFGTEQRRKPPLFLLVVDDIYLNPASSIELLRLLRMISSPQLFVLLLGDYDLLEYLFCQQTLGDYIKLAGDAALRNFGGDFKEEIKSRAWALAAGSLRKLLPPTQQTDLSILWIDEALSFRALDARDKEEPVQLAGLLGQLRIGQGNFPSTVEELITAGWQAREIEEAKPETKPDWGRYVYTGSLLLEMPPRHATDLWMKLSDNEKQWNNKENHSPTDDTIELLGDEFRSALDEQNRVYGPQKKKLERAITRGDAQSLFENYKIHTNQLSINPTNSKNKNKTITPDARGSIPGTTIIHTSEHIEWRMSTMEEDLDLPPRPLGWLVVLHDVLVLGRPQNVLGRPLMHGSDHLRWVSFSWKEKGADDGKPKDSENLYWPVPEWSTFLEFDLLRWAWNNLATESAGRPIHWEVQAFRWLDAICSILTKNKTKKLVYFADPSARPEKPEPLWKELVARIRSLADSAEEKASKTTHDWIVDVGIVVALRLGISEDIAKYFEQDQVLNDFWRNATDIKEIRNAAPGKRVFPAYAAKYFPDEWPPVLATGELK